ncbi:hypothetical protein DPMN_067537 [Dreissena polymorpha]|uniref:Uncharacterized protein n=1 Tax=Dreissena polymorpha TaxID=45954 RepID=A0A9D3YVF5_DREPO|nr:hypothetical protein DPMN_067537 [Dreissena polymorpha]
MRIKLRPNVYLYSFYVKFEYGSGRQNTRKPEQNHGATVYATTWLNFDEDLYFLQGGGSGSPGLCFIEE